MADFCGTSIGMPCHWEGVLDDKSELSGLPPESKVRQAGRAKHEIKKNKMAVDL